MLRQSKFGTVQPFPLVDLQVNGGWGVDFSSIDVTKEELRYCMLSWFDSGVAALLPTIVSSSDEVYQRNLPLLAAIADESTLRNRMLGIHLEGPFLSKDPRVLGAHRAVNLQPASTMRLDRMIELSQGRIRMLTVAAEIPAARELIRYACHRGIAVAIGHSYYTSEDLMRAAAVGATALTHVGNALPSLIDRHQNPIIAALLADQLTAMFIADGHHLSIDMLRLLFKTRTIDRLVAVSDASPVAGLPPGEYQVLSQKARLMPDGALRNFDENHLVGSSANLLTCLDYLVNQGICAPSACARMAGINPLALIAARKSELASCSSMIIYDQEQGHFVNAKGYR